MPRKRPHRRSTGLRLRIALFAILTLALGAGSVYALWPRELAQPDGDVGDVDVTLRITMEGFTPPNLTVPANRLVRVRIVNPDNAHHSDGGGIHQYAVDKLGVNAKVQPETIQIVTIPPSPAGEYDFYCDTCCGGKENPTMQGKLKVVS